MDILIKWRLVDSHATRMWTVSYHIREEITGVLDDDKWS
jgi:hypothetical protein